MTAAWDREEALRVVRDLEHADEYEPLGHDGWTAAALLRAALDREAAAMAEVERQRLLVQVMNRCAEEAEAERDAARAEVERLRGLLWYAWSEFNAIRARSGAPLTHDGMTTVAEEWWDQMTEAFEAAIGEDAANPWPSPEARAALANQETGR